MHEIDIRRTAAAVILEFGEGATLISARRSTKLRNRGDVAGAKDWDRIVLMIGVQEREHRIEREKLNSRQFLRVRR